MRSLLSEMLDFLLLPSNALGLLAVLGIVMLAVGRRSWASILLGTAAGLFIVLGWLPVGSAALIFLENRFPRPEIRGPVAGIIMLGGEVDTHITAERGAVALTDAGERLTSTAELSRQFPAARVVLSGGAVPHVLTGTGETESALGRDLLVAIGVPATRIELDELSKTTWENAVESRNLARPQEGEQWLLVTSASHMPRAVASFRAVGFEVVPYPVDYRTRGTADLRSPISSIALGLQQLDLAAHEWLGLVIYRITRTDELFPAPRLP